MEFFRKIMILVMKVFLLITIGIIIVSLLFFVVQVFIVNKPIDVATMIKKNFSVVVPNPDHQYNIFSGPMFFGEGESYFIYTYSDQCFKQVRESNTGILIDENNMIEMEDSIKNFIKDTTDTYWGEEKEQYKKLFEENPIAIKPGDRLLYEKMNKGYQILLIKADENKIYHLRMGKTN